ncbi:MAG: SDR family oxidoreductase [Pseudomonadota bacterium]
MDLGIDGKIALVAASSRGIGWAVASALAKEGARLAMCARNKDELESAADRICANSGAEVFTFPVDLSKSDGPKNFVTAAIEQFGGADILVTNTGGPKVGDFDSLPDSDWEDAAQLVLMSAVRLIRETLPTMKKRGGGRIINVASISVKEPIPGLLLSNAFRSAVVGMAKTIASELAPSNILVNNVCPGRISTERLVQLEKARAERANTTVQEIRAQEQQKIPLGRYGQPEELAALVTFLASSQASYITGTTILCDGGLFSGMM